MYHSGSHSASSRTCLFGSHLLWLGAIESPLSKRRLKEKVVKIRKGFTLTELLVVIAIIALLMAILMPALQRVKRQAGKAACQSNLKQMGLVVSMYTNDFDGKFHQESPAGPQHSWVYAMRPYYSHEAEIGNCPLVHHIDRHTGFVNGVFVDFSVRSIGLKELWELRWYHGWPEDRRKARTPVWSEWMQHYKDYAPD